MDISLVLYLIKAWPLVMFASSPIALKAKESLRLGLILPPDIAVTISLKDGSSTSSPIVPFTVGVTNPINAAARLFGKWGSDEMVVLSKDISIPMLLQTSISAIAKLFTIFVTVAVSAILLTPFSVNIVSETAISITYKKYISKKKHGLTPTVIQFWHGIENDIYKSP